MNFFPFETHSGWFRFSPVFLYSFFSSNEEPSPWVRKCPLSVLWCHTWLSKLCYTPYINTFLQEGVRCAPVKCALVRCAPVKCTPVKWFLKKYLCFISQFLRTWISLNYLNLFEFLSVYTSLVYECAPVTNLAPVIYTP